MTTMTHRGLAFAAFFGLTIGCFAIAAFFNARDNQLIQRIFALEDRLATAEAAVSFVATQQMTAEQVGVVMAANRPSSELSGLSQIAQASFAEDLEKFVRFEFGPINGLPGPHVIFEGVNLHVRNGQGDTVPDGDDPNGVGNFVIGYNEPAPVSGGFENVASGRGANHVESV